MRKRFTILLFGLSLFSGLAAGQSNIGPGNPNLQPGAAPAAPVSVKIGPGDLISIWVFDVPELNQSVRVGADGKAEMSLIGSTAVAGLTPQQAAALVARELRDRHFLLKPQVNVMIDESAAQGVSVVGEVQHPGVYQVLGPRTLLDVISMAGGLTSVANTKVSVTRRNGRTESISANLKNDDPRSAVSNDVQVFPGDLVMVPRAGIVYVLGDVNRPGGFVMQDNGAITMLQALAQAGGTDRTASPNSALLMRKDAHGYVTQKVAITRIERGKEQDVELRPDDILFVPNSRFKNALRDTQSVATSIGSASIYAIVH
ncbi:MAG: SLBB domain-containing protein [Acidobacteria bacterium]|nr:SLBB domain-containing protein [Acidobacteriota bacterium]